MALRNQPYIPLYIQDYLTDEKLNMCSAATQGVYIKIMCVMHKSDEYGKVLLKQKDKQNNEQVNNFALKLAKLLPFTFDIILPALNELLDEKVLFIEGDSLCQKRMIKDEKISSLRANAGSKGGKKTQSFKDFAKAKNKASSEDEYEIEAECEVDNDYEIYMKIWNLFADKNGLAKISKLTDKRISNIRNRLKEKDFNFEEILNYIIQSDFLLGKKADWKIDFDFIFGSKNNYIKILEGKYNNNGKSGATAQQLYDVTLKHFGTGNGN